MPDTGSGTWSMTLTNSGSSVPPETPDANASRQEVRCAVRFPIILPVVVATESGDLSAFTKNVSANGVLFELDRDLSVGLDIHFDLRMPHTVLGTPHDVLVHCTGRVVRCSISQNQHLAAATIDEYRFAEQ
jgi:PilZ domain